MKFLFIAIVWGGFCHNVVIYFADVLIIYRTLPMHVHILTQLQDNKARRGCDRLHGYNTILDFQLVNIKNGTEECATLPSLMSVYGIP